MRQTDWDDLRVFLALVRSGNVRRAGALLAVSHSTVARRVERFEQRLKVKLFERQPEGYQLTAAGAEVMEAAERVESEFDAVSRRVLGHERQLAGRLRVTMVDVLATHLLMPDITRFCELYPDIDIELLISYESADLSRREADIAIRLTEHPPENLIGRQIGKLAHAGYAAPAYLEQHDLDDPADASWIGFGRGERFPSWVRHSGYPHLPARGIYDSLLLQISAARSGLGLAFLPCFVGDTDPGLVRIDAPERFPSYPIWVLRHPDSRETVRLRVFAEFIADAIASHAAVLGGEPAAQSA